MRRVEFNRTGAKRKALITAIGEILGTKAKYMGMPTMAYDFGGLVVDKTGALEFEDNIFPKDIKHLLKGLAEKGFTAENSEDEERAEALGGVTMGGRGASGKRKVAEELEMDV